MISLRKLPPTVLVLGFVSFFNDLASEMVTPLIPILLAGVMGAGPVILGLVEGVADAVSAFLRLWSGRHSDALGGRRKGLTLFGYLLSNLVRPLMGLAGSWPHVVGLRAIDRVGKGIRSAPRDALVSDATPEPIRGLAYGFQRAMDNGGAMAGALAAAAVLAWSDVSLTQIILLSAVPGLAGVALVAFGVREVPRKAVTSNASVPGRPVWSALSPAMRAYMIVLVVFTFARASETFVVLRGHQMDMGVVELLLVWSALSLAKAMSSWLGGGWADRLGHRRMVMVGWLVHGAAFAGLALIDSPAGLWAAAIAYGSFTGAAEGAERALVGEMARVDERGTAFGWYNMVLGLSAIPAGLLFGGVWQHYGAPAAFSMAAVLAWIATLLMNVYVMRRAQRASSGI